MDCLSPPQLISGAIDQLHVAQDFEALAHQFRPKIFRFILASVRDADLADNLTQECLLRGYQAYGRFRGDCRLDTWLLQIAVNLMRDHGRSRRLQFWRRTQKQAIRVGDVHDYLADQSRSPEADVLRSERIKSIWAAVEQLSERQRSVFLLRFVEDMEVLEIATVTGMKEGTVKTHLFRAVQTVKAQLGA